MNDTVLHIGIQRTGTTFLQNLIFPHLKNVNLISKHHMELLYLLRSPELKVEDKKKVLKYFKDDQINLISDENIWWHYVVPWFIEDIENRRIEHIDKIHELFPDAKIIFGTRDIDSLIVSLYNYYILYGGYLKFEPWQKEYHQYTRANINYDSYIEHLFKIYGKENVYIYQFGDMKKDVNQFVKGICDFIGTETPTFSNKRINSGHSLWQLKVSRIMNRFFRSEYNPKGFLPMKINPQTIVFRSLKFPKKLRGRNPKPSDFNII
ncbi:MAG: sulfotransferase [Candidatus Thermoplasmatota archaeon]|nr:sulfotransferase [Candidatus Thermoplasmatota archaeon]